MRAFEFIAVTILLVLAGCSRNDSAQPKLKMISYSGGVVEFSIPASWKEEYDKDGQGTFYDAQSPDSGALRINLITAKSPNPLTENSATEILKSIKKSPLGRIESLANGNALLTYSEPASEAGHQLHVFFWMVANPVKPDHIRVAIFSYTLLEGQQEQKRFRDEISLIDGEIRKVSFSKELGVTVAN